MKRLFYMLLLILPMPLQAQEATPIPWPPNPAEVFAPGIEVVEVITEWPAPTEEPSAWIYVTDEARGETRLQNSVTGFLSDPLPQEATWHEIHISPNGEWLVLLATVSPEGGYGSWTRLYSYRVSTGDVLMLGNILPDISGSLNISRWANETQFIYSYYNAPGRYGNDMVIVDVTQEDAIEHAIEYLAPYREDARRYEYLSTHYILARRGDYIDHNPCVLSIFDLDDMQKKSYKLDYDCGGVYSPDEDHYFYVVFDSDSPAQSTLWVLDVTSEERTALYTAEIEALENISPDGRYAVLITDNNGRIDRAGGDPQFFSWTQAANPTISELDIHEEKIIYEMPFHERESRGYCDTLYEEVSLADHCYWSLHHHALVWLNAETAVGWQTTQAGDSFEDVLLRFSQDEVFETPLGLVTLIAPGNRLLVVSADRDDPGILELYDAESGQQRPFIHLNDDFVTQMQVYRQDNLLEVVLSAADRQWARYYVRVER